MKNIIFLLFFFFQSQEVYSYEGLKKINDDLYVGKVAEGFYLAMERINKDNVDMWRNYAKNQRDLINASTKKFKYLPNDLGTLAFYYVLTDYSNGEIKSENELWVTYISTVPVTKKAHLDIQSGKGANPTIEMFVTVITSPKALLTSHMGISRTWESAYDLEFEPLKRKKYTDQSIHLHSFAAKVMKTIDTNKFYMLTIPVDIMRTILIKKMPQGTVFIGDNDYQKNMEEAHKKISNKEIEELKANPARIRKKVQGSNVEFTILKPNGKEPLVSFNQDSTVYQWLFTDSYQSTLLPYVLIELDSLANATKLAN